MTEGIKPADQVKDLHGAIEDFLETGTLEHLLQALGIEGVEFPETVKKQGGFSRQSERLNRRLRAIARAVVKTKVISPLDGQVVDVASVKDTIRGLIEEVYEPTKELIDPEGRNWFDVSKFGVEGTVPGRVEMAYRNFLANRGQRIPNSEEMLQLAELISVLIPFDDRGLPISAQGVFNLFLSWQPDCAPHRRKLAQLKVIAESLSGFDEEEAGAEALATFRRETAQAALNLLCSVAE